MLAHRKALFIAIVMFMAPLVSAIQSDTKPNAEPTKVRDSNWHQLEPTSTVLTGLKSLDYNIYLESAIFAPLVDEIPKSKFD